MKVDLDKVLNLEELKIKFFAANTPFYLYEHFSKNASVMQLSLNYTSEILIKYFKNIARKKIDDLETLVKIYAVVIALTLKEYSEVFSFIKSLGSYRFRWFNEIKEIFMSQSSTSQFHDKTSRKIIVLPSYSNETAYDITAFDSKDK